MNKTLYSRIKQRRKQLGLGQEELAKKVGYSGRSIISLIEAEKINLSESRISDIASALNTTPEYLLGIFDDPELGIGGIIDDGKDTKLQVTTHNTLMVPLFKPITEESQLNFIDNIREYVPLQLKTINKNSIYFSQLANDNSLETFGIKKGTVLIFERQSSLKIGQIGYFIINNQRGVTRIFNKNKDIISLETNSLKYPSILLNNNTTECQCLGKLFATVKYF